MKKDQLEFVAVLAQDYPKQGAYLIGLSASRLMALARKAQNDATALCNGYIQQDEYDKRHTKTSQKVFSVLSALAESVPAKFEVGGDPRGYCLKVFMPSGRYNTFGGKESGYGVPC